MNEIPFRRFEGFLKQHSHESLSPLEQELFEALFPSFEGDDEAEKAFAEWKNNPLLEALGGLITAAPGERRQRRYAGNNFPRRRYYAVASDSDGNDNQTLAHELRAYRNPIDYGMVEVIDLAGGCNLMLKSETIELPPRQGIAVLIHNLDLLPDKFRAMPFQPLPSLKDNPIFLYRFPYNVSHKTIERVIDLRYPSVQKWFFEAFRIPSEQTDSKVIENVPDPTIAHSRFHLVNGRATAPASFWKMLPTLMNPDLGGGNPGTTGSTVQLIGHWMRQHQVGAFIYPSARCDVTALFQNGELHEFYGWNLVHYEDCEPIYGRANIHVITFDPSPWAWVAFEDGIKLHVAPDGEMTGSFKVDGVVNYWAKDHIRQIKALETARSIHGREARFQSVTKEVRTRGFRIGVLCIRWLRLVLDHKPQATIDEQLLELQGLALSFGISEVSGRIGELWNSVKRGGVNFGSMVAESVGVADRVGFALGRKFSDDSLGSLVQFGNDFEFVLLKANVLLQRGEHTSQPAISELAQKHTSKLTTWFDGNTAKLLLDFLAEMPRKIGEGGRVANEQISTGESLIKMASKALRS